MKEARIEVNGIVQGIHFRKLVKDFAFGRGLKGCVMNLSNGGVLIIAQGREEDINEIVLWLRRNPGFSKVDNIDVNLGNAGKLADDFVIVREGNFLIDIFKSVVRLLKRIFGFNKEEKFDKIPSHVTIIPDGNRRWARYRGLEPHFGHYKSGSYKNIEALLLEAKRIGIKYVSIWGFSTENWKRSEEEKMAIFDLLSEGVNRFRKFARNNKIRFKHIGRKDRLPKELIKSLNELEKETKEYSELTVLLCLDYGGRDEIIRAVNKALKSGRKEIDEKEFLGFLDSYGDPDPDFIIRTSGEQRVSGFMPFQAAYSELYFSEVYFPDFNVEELRKAIREYGRRIRRFGGE